MNGMSIVGGDDVDLGLRVNKSGYLIKCNPEAEVLHAQETWGSFIAVWRRAFRWGRMDLHLYHRKHEDRVAAGLPKFSSIFLMLALVATVEAIIHLSALPLLIPILWAALTLILQAAASVIITSESWRCFFHEMLADVMGLGFEFGTLIEGLVRKEPSVFYKTVQRGPVLPTFEQREWVAQSWSMWVAIVLTLLAQGAWL